MYCRICPCCGAYLDPGERCDCTEKEEAAPKLEPLEAAQMKIITTRITDLGGFVNVESIYS